MTTSSEYASDSRISHDLFVSASRRAVLGGLASTAVTCISAPASAKLMTRWSKIKVGLELYTVNSAMRTDFDRTLHQVAALGYRTVEFPWFYGRPANDVRRSLMDTGLRCESALFYPTKSVAREDKNLVDDLPELIEFATTIGLKYMGAVVFPLRPGFDPVRAHPDDYKRAADFLNAVGMETRKAGIQFTYHNHDFEFVDIGGTRGFEVLLNSTDSGLVKSALDVGWVVHAGGDPLNYLTKYRGRFATLHLRDLIPQSPPRPMSMNAVSLGRGIIDWKPLLDAASAAGVEYGYVEHDPREPAASMEMANESLVYLKKLLG